MTAIKRATIMQVATTLSVFTNEVTVRSVSGKHNLALIDGLPVSVELIVDHDKDDYVCRGYLVGKLVYAHIGYFGTRYKENVPETVDKAFTKIVDRMWFDSFQNCDHYTDVSSAMRLDRECFDIPLPAKLLLTVNREEVICRTRTGEKIYHEQRTFSKDLTQLVPMRAAITRYLTTNHFSKFNF